LRKYSASLTGQLIYGILYLTMLYLLNVLTTRLDNVKTKRLFIIFYLKTRELEAKATLVVSHNCYYNVYNIGI